MIIKEEHSMELDEKSTSGTICTGGYWLLRMWLKNEQ